MRRIAYLLSCLLAAPLAAEEPSQRPAEAWPDLAAANFIDEHVFARLRELAVVPSRLSGDAEFLRRVALSTTGQLPAAAEVRQFLADSQPDKRARKIEERLAHPLRAALWATRFSELTGNSLQTLEGPEELKAKRAKMWHDWLRKRFADNLPYNELVRGILTATSRDAGDAERWIDAETALVLEARQNFAAPYADRTALELFWRRDDVQGKYPLEELAERISSGFLGVRINCARCHKHPFDRWTQGDYQAFAGIFSQVRFDLSPEVRSRLSERIVERRNRVAGGYDVGPPLPRVREVYVAEVPTTSAVGRRMAKALGGPVLVSPMAAATTSLARSSDARVGLMNWLEDPQNPYFAANIVNRVWAYHFGRGLVEPLDGFSTANQPSHPALLADLASDFVAHGYDLLRLERLILNATAWQLSSEPNDSNRHEAGSFARALVRIPPAETVIDMWQAATGARAKFGDNVPAGSWAVELGPTRLGVSRWDHVLDLFGRLPRTQTCDCTPLGNPSIRQTLALMSDANLLNDLSSGQLSTLLDSGLWGDPLIEELFLRTLSRLPTAEERAASLQALAAATDERQMIEDLLWALVNSQEFITNH